MSNPPRRLANLPGYDTAPDIYETPDPVSATSSVPTQPTSPSAASASSSNTTSASHNDSDSDSEAQRGVSNRHIRASRARGHFADGTKGVEIEARGTDLSERVDGGRRGYGVGRVRGRGGLGERLARLKREVEECRALASQEGGHEETAGFGGEVEGLGKLLGEAEIEARTERAHKGAAKEDEEEEEDDEEKDVTDEQTLKKVVDFDSRIAMLESALGISALDSTDAAPVAPLLPSLDLLDTQLSALTAATSLSALESAHSKIRALRADTEALAQTHVADTPASATSTEDGESTGGEDSRTAPPGALTHDDLAKMHDLYHLLPTLQSLSPTVPALLARLRSLRTLHAGAANAASDLDEVERRQDEMDEELKKWRKGLEKVETAVKESGEANGRNGKVVQEWVKELEERCEKVAR